MLVKLLPFQHIRAVTDHSTGEIFCRLGSGDGELREDFTHELAHLNSGDPDHGDAFRSALKDLSGVQPPEDDLFKRLRPRLGLSRSVRLSANVGNVTGIQNVLTDLHLLAAYRKFSKKVLNTEGHWEVMNEVDGDSSKQLIRLYPTPKGSFPVTVVYYPVVTHFRSPQAKKLAYDMLLAEAKCMLGAARRKLAGLPTPDGGSISYDGEALAQEGEKERDEIVTKALQLGEPDRVFVWGVLLPFIMTLFGSFKDFV